MTNAIIRVATASTVVDLASNKNRNFAMCDWFQVGLQFGSAISESSLLYINYYKQQRSRLKKECMSQYVLLYLLIFWFHFLVWGVSALQSRGTECSLEQQVNCFWAEQCSPASPCVTPSHTYLLGQCQPQGSVCGDLQASSFLGHL